jgi:hypothetical protein
MWVLKVILSMLLKRIFVVLDGRTGFIYQWVRNCSSELAQRMNLISHLQLTISHPKSNKMDSLSVIEQIKKLRQWMEAGTQLYFTNESGLWSNGLPAIKTAIETFGVIKSVDTDKFMIVWDNQYEARILTVKRPHDVLPIQAVSALIPREEWENSEEFKSLSSSLSKFVDGELCYLSSKYKNSGEADPRVGSSYERHGKIIGSFSNRNRTYEAYNVRWFLGRDANYEAKWLLTKAEYSEYKLKEKKKIQLLDENDPLVPQGSVFILTDDGYVKTSDESIFIHAKHVKKLFKKEK